MAAQIHDLNRAKVVLVEADAPAPLLKGIGLSYTGVCGTDF